MKEWNQFMKSMVNHAREQYKSKEAYEHYKHRKEEIDAILDGCLLEEQKEIVDSFLKELDDAAHRELESVYFQGMLDSVSILRILGALV